MNTHVAASGAGIASMSQLGLGLKRSLVCVLKIYGEIAPS